MSDIHIKIDGISGTNPQDKKSNTAAIDTFSFGVSKPSGLPGTQGARDPGKATPHAATVYMDPDDTSTGILMACCEGTLVKTISIVQTGTNNEPVYEMVFGNAIVTAVSTCVITDEMGRKRLQDCFSFTYASVTRRQLSGQGSGGQNAAGWDFVQNKRK